MSCSPFRNGIMFTVLKETTTLVKRQGVNFKNTQLYFICPSSTKKMTSDCNRNRVCLKAFITSHSLSRNVTEQTTSKHVIEIQFLLIQDYELNDVYILFSFFCSFFPRGRLQIIKALGQPVAESTLRSLSLHHYTHKWCNLIMIINVTNMRSVPVLITFHISRLFWS